MDLFNILPDDLFNVLTGKNKHIYAKSLMLLSNSLEHDQLKIKRADFIQNIRDLDIDWSGGFEYEEKDLDEGTPNITSKISYIVNRLENCGWIEPIIDENNEEFLALPDYVIHLLSAFRNILSDGETMYDSLVHSTYSELKIEDENPDDFLYTTLLKAYQNTKKLRLDLITLGHSIQISANKLGKLFSTNEILVDHFDRFKERVANRYYHPLKTFDSITRFKRPIVNILTKWLNDREIRQRIAAQSIMFQREKDYKLAEKNVVTMIMEICDMFEQFGGTIDKIDDEYAKYTKSSVSKIIYLNNSDKSIKGHLQEIFKFYAQSVVKGDYGALSKVLGNMQDASHAYEHGYIESDSITLPFVRNDRELQEPLALYDMDGWDDSLMMDITLAARESLTDSKIYEFMEKVFQERDFIDTVNIPLQEYNNFIIYILAVARSTDASCFYYIENLDNHEYISLHGYYVPNLHFVRKEKGEE